MKMTFTEKNYFEVYNREYFYKVIPLLIEINAPFFCFTDLEQQQMKIDIAFYLLKKFLEDFEGDSSQNVEEIFAKLKEHFLGYK